MKLKKLNTPILVTLVIIPVLLSVGVALNHVDLSKLFADRSKTPTIVNAAADKRESFNKAVKRSKSSEDSRLYTYEYASYVKQNKNTFVGEADLEATSNAIEATVSKEDKTIVEYKIEDISDYKEDGSLKTEQEKAQEVVQKAKEDSAANEDVIIAVDRETYEKATETPVKEPKQETPVEDKTPTGTATDTTVVETPNGDVEIADKFTTDEPVRVDSTITVEIPDGSGETIEIAESFTSDEPITCD